MRAVNLLARNDFATQTRGAGRRASVPIVGGAGAAAVCALLALLFLTTSSGVSSKEQDLEALRTERAALAKAAGSLGSASLIAERRSREAALAGALSGRIAWDRVLRRLALVLPRDVWVTGLTASAPTATTTATSAAPVGGAGTPTGFNLRGYALSHPQVARTLTRLAVLPDLSDVQLVSSAETVVENRRLYVFTIVGNIRPSGAS